MDINRLAGRYGWDDVPNPVNRCSHLYWFGQAAGVAWWTAFGGAIASRIAGTSVLEKEFADITLTDSEFAGERIGRPIRSRAARLGGPSGSLAQTIKNVSKPSWWRTVARTTRELGLDSWEAGVRLQVLALELRRSLETQKGRHTLLLNSD